MKRSDVNYLLHREELFQDLLEAGKQAMILLEKYVPKRYLAIGMENLRTAIKKAEGNK